MKFIAIAFAIVSTVVAVFFGKILAFCGRPQPKPEAKQCSTQRSSE